MSANQGTSSAKIHCPHCNEPLLSQVALGEGSRFVVKCAKCHRFTKIVAGFNKIEKRLMNDVREVITITET